MRRMIITSSLLLAISATAMASQVYKWVDEQGVTHFSAQPPQGQAPQSQLSDWTCAVKSPPAVTR